MCLEEPPSYASLEWKRSMFCAVATFLLQKIYDRFVNQKSVVLHSPDITFINHAM